MFTGTGRYQVRVAVVIHKLTRKDVQYCVLKARQFCKVLEKAKQLQLELATKRFIYSNTK